MFRTFIARYVQSGYSRSKTRIHSVASALTDEQLNAKNLRLQRKLTLRYDKALRKAVKMERKLLKRKHEKSVYPTMAQQVDFSLNPYRSKQYAPAPYRTAQAAHVAAPLTQQFMQQQPQQQQQMLQQQPQVEPQMIQRQWSNLGRLYTCYTCMGCMMAIPCQQQIYQPQMRPQPAMMAPIGQSPVASPCQQMAAQQRPSMMSNNNNNNCQCAQNRRTCSQPHTRGCEEAGQFYAVGQSTVKPMSNGGFIKCQCIPKRNEAVWRCNPMPQQANVGRATTKHRTCYDGTMPGVPFLPNEQWKSTREDKQYSCSCKKRPNGKSRTECSLLSNQNEPNQRPYCIDTKSETKKEINEKWESGSRECACLLDISGKPTIDCRKKMDSGCIIKGSLVRFGDVVPVGEGQRCKCSERGMVDCFTLCMKNNAEFNPGETTTTNGGGLCTCVGEGEWQCEMTTTVSNSSDSSISSSYSTNEYESSEDVERPTRTEFNPDPNRPEPIRPKANRPKAKRPEPNQPEPNRPEPNRPEPNSYEDEYENYDENYDDSEYEPYGISGEKPKPNSPNSLAPKPVRYFDERQTHEQMRKPAESEQRGQTSPPPNANGPRGGGVTPIQTESHNVDARFPSGNRPSLPSRLMF